MSGRAERPGNETISTCKSPATNPSADKVGLTPIPSAGLALRTAPDGASGTSANFKAGNRSIVGKAWSTAVTVFGKGFSPTPLLASIHSPPSLTPS